MVSIDVRRQSKPPAYLNPFFAFTQIDWDPEIKVERFYVVLIDVRKQIEPPAYLDT